MFTLNTATPPRKTTATSAIHSSFRMAGAGRGLREAIFWKTKRCSAIISAVRSERITRDPDG